jgi:hypothetical protein
MTCPKPTRAANLDTAVNAVVAGIVVASVAIGVGITLIVLHEKHKKISITGCIVSSATGMSLTNEKDKRTYTLAGVSVGIKAGERMTLEGKRHGAVFEASGLTKDLGLCQP